MCSVLSFIHSPNRKMDKSASPWPQLILFRVGLTSLSINMHEPLSFGIEWAGSLCICVGLYVLVPVDSGIEKDLLQV